MKKIVLSLGMIVFVGAIVIGATGAFFSDTETSTGNTFTAGAIDLQIDNESYYNGDWNEGTSWGLSDLNGSQQFFNFLDLKPGDWGEDTISLHINNNDAYACLDVRLDANDENTQTEPELNDEGQDDDGIGELANEVKFFWWADDGDNVYEDGEYLIDSEAVLGALEVGQVATVALADTSGNAVFEGPLTGDQVYYLGKAWCFGDTEFLPLDQDNKGYLGQNQNGPDVRGVNCDGSNENNSTQTDGLEATISFMAVQARNNDNFQCRAHLDGGQQEPEGPVVEEGSMDFDEYAGGRFRSFGNTGGQEIYAGHDDLGDGSNRSASEFVWTSQGTHSVSVSYDASEDEVTASVDSTDVTHTSALTCTPDKLQFHVVARDDGSTVALNNVDLNGNALGNFEVSEGDASEWVTWNVTGFDFSSDFTFSGDLELTGTFGSSQEDSKVQVDFGCAS